VSESAKERLEAVVMDYEKRLAEVAAERDEYRAVVDAIRCNQVDALVVDDEGPKVYTLKSADLPYRMLVEQMGEGALTASPDGSILYCNGCLARLAGSRAEHIIAAPLSSLFAPGDHAALDALLQQGSGRRELTLVSRHGECVPVYVGASRLTIEGVEAVGFVITDLSQQKSQERVAELNKELQRQLREGKRQSAALRESEARFHAAIDHLPDSCVIFDAERRLTYANAAAARVFGRDPAELIGCRDEDLWPRETRVRVLAALDQACRDCCIQCLETSAVTSDGRPATHVHTYVPLPDSQERGVVQILGIMHDITEQRMAEQALREGDRRKDEFMAMLAHELRNPLAAVSAASALLLRPELSPDKASLAKNALRERVTQIVRLVDDLLDVSRIVRGKVELRRQSLDLAQVVHAAVESTKGLFEERGQTLTVHTLEALPVNGDPVRLEQVVSNLLSNAARYTQDGGTVSLIAAQDGAEAVIKVKDNGVGVEPALITKIFDLFGQVEDALHRSRGGLGVGLTMVKKLTVMHGGSVSAYSAGPGKGSEFTVRLPIASAERRTEEAEGDLIFVEPGLRVLVVEDHNDTALMTAVALELQGHHVEIAEDGPTALRMAENNPPQVVLLDIGLPHMDGFSVAKELRKKGLRDALIVAVTGFGQERDYERSRAAGIDHHLLKPLDYTKLAPLLAEYQQKRILLSEQCH